MTIDAETRTSEKKELKAVEAEVAKYLDSVNELKKKNGEENNFYCAVLLIDITIDESVENILTKIKLLRNKLLLQFNASQFTSIGIDLSDNLILKNSLNTLTESVTNSYEFLTGSQGKSYIEALKRNFESNKSSRILREAISERRNRYDMIGSLNELSLKITRALNAFFTETINRGHPDYDKFVPILRKFSNGVGMGSRSLTIQDQANTTSIQADLQMIGEPTRNKMVEIINEIGGTAVNASMDVNNSVTVTYNLE